MRTLRLLVLVVVSCMLILPGLTANAVTFAPGDVFVSTAESGTVQVWSSDGSFKGLIVGTVPGNAEGLRFDAAGNLYVTHWCLDQFCLNGNTIERFDPSGTSLGTFGSGYWCNPSALAFDATGSAYVGQAHCSAAVLKFSGSGQPVAAYPVAGERFGSFKVDVAADGCTLFYTSWSANVKRFDVCANAQLPDFNLAPMPGDAAGGLRVLPDGGVLVGSGPVIARLDSSGALVQSYSLGPFESQYWLGLDLVGDGTFWAVNSYNYFSFLPRPNVFRFDLATGAVLASFSTGTSSVVDVVVRR